MISQIWETPSINSKWDSPQTLFYYPGLITNEPVCTEGVERYLMTQVVRLTWQFGSLHSRGNGQWRKPTGDGSLNCIGVP